MKANTRNLDPVNELKEIQL